MTKNIFKNLALLSAPLFFTACEKYVDIAPPVSSFVASTAFSTDALVESDIAGLYSYNFLTSAYHSTYRHLFPGFASDELLMYTTTYDEFVYNSIIPTNTLNRYLWSEPYKSVYQCNLMIESLQKNTTIRQVLKDEALGTARFLRALNYLNLVSLFGDVPLVLTSDVTVSGSLPRNPKSEVFAQIITDLKEAKQLITGPGKSASWLSQAAVSALLSRAYLYNSQWQDAAAEADLFVNGQWKSSYRLDTIEKAFVRGSNEAILTISSDGSNRGIVNHNNIGRTYIPASSVRATYYLTDDFMNAFEAGDLRKANWTKQFTARAPFVYYPNKYKLRVAPQNAEDAEDQILFRLAEVLLIHAEANAQLNKLPESLSSLNKIRERAGLKPLSSNLTKDQVLLAVEQERHVELFSEYGHRWVDLVRTGRADAVLGKHKAATWKSYARLFPVPEKDIELNPNLTQNPGYNAQ